MCNKTKPRLKKTENENLYGTLVTITTIQPVNKSAMTIWQIIKNK